MLYTVNTFMILIHLSGALVVVVETFNSVAVWMAVLASPTGWISMEFDTNIHDPQMINLNDFDDPLTFPVASPAGQSCHFPWPLSGKSVNLSKTLVLDQIHAKLMTFPSSSTVLCLVLISKC